MALPTVMGDLDFWRHGDGLPFEFAWRSGVDAVMTAHVVVPQVDAEVATCSYRWLTEILRGELGFDGLIITDALMMAGITRRYAPDVAVVKALQAGADLLLMPVDAVGAIAAITQAVADGALSMKRLDASLERIAHARQKIRNAPCCALGNWILCPIAALPAPLRPLRSKPHPTRSRAPLRSSWRSPTACPCPSPCSNCRKLRC
ncbi:MAG: hypothetical protein HC919_03735 [Oscillatoriales cyanobacterium SM2_2_1]|nr:hypothetical protein [Oscillatoriales cyanobacterium SM2_2_1]